MKKSFLILQNGVVFEGLSPDWQEEVASGEVVFTTGMTGYTETLTDPSYAGQIIVFTYPLIGNYGVGSEDGWESEKIHAKGVVVSTSSPHFSHYLATCSLQQWLKTQGVALITKIDTRAVTKYLRTSGATLGAISISENPPAQFDDPNQTNLVASVSSCKRSDYGNGAKRVIAVDCGMKKNLLRHLLEYDVRVTIVSHDDDFTEENYDGIFLSNGPGDPTQCPKTLEILKKAMRKKKPIFGVCLGNQMLALAAGAKTYKLKFGHRGQNQPCIDVETGRCYMTSQNHGYAVDEKSLPKDWKVTFRNLNDGSIEGISHRTLPYFSVQFHPEAAPGPTDTKWFFKRFAELL
ncbi:MAG: glutamine-hydrolyzing carbamoyl-phosphate synthase small subunit [Chlamydiia bacterium]|nr:glutamine-hydrolyzing carbamoyl-phosphate synthase small subunit [Chlamydiia bacterium]